MQPYVKWAGGKRQLLEKLRQRIPDRFNAYHEPFVGGGAFLLDLRPAKAFINDTNEQLINCYKWIKENPRAVLSKINDLDNTVCNKEFYLQIRKEYNNKISNSELDAECAAMMIWINKHCFNGLYRTNKKGLFNVPYNNKFTGSSVDETNIMNISVFMNEAEVEIFCQDFEEVCAMVRPEDFVFFDSPYVPVSNTANFTDYTKEGFKLEDHKRLAALYHDLDKRGVYIMLTNHNVSLVHELYHDYKIEEFSVKRAINSDAKKRMGEEVIITNYEY